MFKGSRWTPIFYIFDITNSSSFNGKMSKRKSMFQTFRANVLEKPATASLRFRGICEEALGVVNRSNTRRPCFIGIFKHREQCWKYIVQRSISDGIRGVWIANETLSRVFHISIVNEFEKKFWTTSRFITDGNWTESNFSGLKSYAWFEITSMISGQNCTTRSSIATLLDPILKSHNLIAKTMAFFVFHFPGMLLVSLKKALTHWLPCRP